MWPLTWQSKQATPRMPSGVSVLRSAVALNCCCGNCVTSRRRPSRSLALRMPAKSSWKLSSVTTLPCDTSPRSGRDGQENGRRKLRQEVLGQVEIDVEALPGGRTA